MLDVLDSKMPLELQEKAKKIISQFGLENLKVYHDPKSSAIIFEKDRRVVSVPVVLVDENKWSDIRYLFRATLESGNSLWNRNAEHNEWSGDCFYD